MVHGILFKFAVDSSGLFGGDDAAAAKVCEIERSCFPFFLFLF